MNKNKVTYSSYKNGLEVGDIVYYNIKNIPFLTQSLEYKALVLDREFLFEQETRYGIRSFFKYTFLDIDSKIKKKMFDIKTQNIRVLKTIKTKKEK